MGVEETRGGFLMFLFYFERRLKADGATFHLIYLRVLLDGRCLIG